MIKKLLNLVIFLFLTNVFLYGQAPSNDEPCTATPIPLGTDSSTCSPTVGDNTGATDSANPNIDAPTGCEPISANYNGADVWFSTTVGSTGAIQIDLTHINSSNFDDGVIALYTGSCDGALSIVECDDDSGLGSLEPKLTAFGLTPGETIYIRVWEWEASDEGAFNICVSEPPPACGSTFYDSGDISGNYSNYENETTTFFPDTAGDAVTVTFTLFDLEFADDLYVYDGPDTASTLLGVFNGTTVPGPFSSSHASGALTFVFESDFSVTHAGWEASISCAPYIPPVVCGSTFHDSGGAGGNYGYGETQTTTFNPDNPGEVITVTFTAFNTEEDYDELTVYDGPNNTFPSLGTFSGNTTIPGPFTSTDPTGALTFVFESDGSVQYSGWEADVNCITLCEDNIIATTAGENCGESTVDLSAVGTAGVTEFYWYTTALDETPIATTTTGDWTTPIITSTTTYYVSAYNGTCESDRVPVVANILAEPTDVTISTTMTPIGATECNLQYAELTASGGEFSSSISQTVLEQNFESGLTDGISGTWSTVNNSTGGTPANAAWTIRPDSYYTFYTTFNSNDNSKFILSDSDDQGSSSNTNTELISPVYSLEFFTSASISYYHHYNDFSTTDNARVEISTDGGTTWETATPLRQYTTDQGDTDDFIQDTIDLSDYLGQTTLQIRFKYTAAWDIFWAIDNITIEGEMNIPSSDITWSPISGLFTDASLTTPYNGDPAATVYAAPNGTQIYTATAEGFNGCTKTETVTITRNGKTWNGSQSADWNDPDNWTPAGIPTATDCVVITNAGYSPVLNGTTDGVGSQLTVENGATLTQQPNSILTFTGAITVDAGGTYTMLDTASLFQDTDVANTVNGTFTMDRIANMRENDYVYWSSPVENFQIEDVSPETIGYKYEWVPTVPQGTSPPPENVNMLYGEWQSYNTGTMAIGKGYIIKGPVGHGSTEAPFTAAFSGTPNNGTISQPIERGTHTSGIYTYNPYGNDVLNITNDDDNWNLVGNPYPSALSIHDFLFANTHIDGFVYLWTHGTDIGTENSDPFYDDYAYNYDVADYIAINSAGESTPTGNDQKYIGAGQGFFVLMNDNATPNESVSFQNEMRRADSDYRNDQFFRSTNTPEESEEDEDLAHRIWLDYIDPSGSTNTTLVAYIDGATNDKDRMYDAKNNLSNGLNLYSMINEDAYIIQGRQAPFVDSDTVPLGINITENGIQTLAINTLDGLFYNTDQQIYIEDLFTGITHNLNNEPYNFTSETGIIEDRFILRYSINALSLTDFELSNVNILAPIHRYIKVTSEQSPIESVVVYDLLGRVLFNNDTINETEFELKNHNLSDGAYIVKATLISGRSKTQKIVLKH